MAKLGVPSIRSLYFVNIAKAINLEGIVEVLIDDITKIDIILNSLAFYST